MVGLILLINDNFNVVLIGRLVLGFVFRFVLTVFLVLVRYSTCCVDYRFLVYI